MADIKRMSIQEFRARGYVQELNRQFLHPLGLALEVVINEDGTESLGGVWNSQDDPDGIIFGPDTLKMDKAEAIEWEQKVKHHVRELRLGFVIQPKE